MSRLYPRILKYLLSSALSSRSLILESLTSIYTSSSSLSSISETGGYTVALSRQNLSISLAFQPSASASATSQPSFTDACDSVLIIFTSHRLSYSIFAICRAAFIPGCSFHGNSSPVSLLCFASASGMMTTLRSATFDQSVFLTALEPPVQVIER